MTGSPSPITWKDLERQIRRRCRDGGLRGRVTVTPWTAAEERAAAARDHAYVYPSDLDFHFSSKILALPKANRDAVVDHEVGHCLAQHHWNSSTEDEADAAAQQWLGTKICYDPRWHGKGLQVVCSRAGNPARKVKLRTTPTQLREALLIYTDYGGAKVGEIASQLLPEDTCLSGSRGPLKVGRRTHQTCFVDRSKTDDVDLKDLEHQLRTVATENEDGLWTLKSERNLSPDFETYDEACAWVDRKAKEYGGKNNFLSSDEYREAYPKIAALHAAGHRVYTARKQDDLAEAGLRSGDRVTSTTQGIFGPGDSISGTITMRKGVPWVKLDEPTAVSVEGRVSIRSSVRWTPRWQNLERNPTRRKRQRFHAAPPGSRQSIATHGLRPGTEASYGPPGVYMFKFMDLAADYRENEPRDVWEIDATGLELHPDPEDPKVAEYSLDPIPPERIRLVGTFLAGERQDNPSRVRRGTPPPVLSGYLMKSAIDARYRGVYFVGDTQIASSRTTPAPSSIPVGTWRYDDQFKGVYGHEIDELVEIDPHDLELSEFREDQFREGLRMSGKLEDAERYAQWLAAGNEMPPITVVETDRDTLEVSDGHRRTYAAMLANVPVRAWISWLAPHPQGRVDATGRPMKVGLTYEIATGRMASREKNPRQTRISRRIASAGS